MVARMSPLFEYSETALSVVLVIGAITAFFMGLLGLVQNDYQACRRLFDAFATRLYDGGTGRVGLLRGDFSSRHPCIFQSIVISRRGLSHHRPASRARHAQHGRFVPPTCVSPG